jgi:hypothetical protein
MSAKSPVCGPAARGLDGGDATAAPRESGDGRVLEDLAAVVLQRPGISLNRALGIGVAAEVQVGAPDGVVAGDRHELLELLAIEPLPAESPRLADLGPAPGQRELRVAQRDADSVRLVFGGISEQLVHVRPEALLFEAEGAIDVRGPAAVAPGGLPSHDALLQHEHIDARAGQPPSRAEAGDSPADDDHRCATRSRHRARLP